MRNIKGIIAVGLAFVLAFALVACGQDEDEDSDKEAADSPKKEELVLNNSFVSQKALHAYEPGDPKLPLWQFDYPDNWRIMDHELDYENETVSLVNDQGVEIIFSNADMIGASSTHGAGVSYKVESMGSTKFKPVEVENLDASEYKEDIESLKELEVVKLSPLEATDVDPETGKEENKDVSNQPPSFAVVPKGFLDEEETSFGHLLYIDTAFAYTGAVSFSCEKAAPNKDLESYESGDKKYEPDEKTEKEIVEILKSLRLYQGENVESKDLDPDRAEKINEELGNVKLNKTYNTKFGEKFMVTVPEFTFSYPSNWKIASENYDGGEKVVLENEKGVQIEYRNFKKEDVNFEDKGQGMDVKLSDAAPADFKPDGVQAVSHERLGDFVVVRATPINKVSGGINNIKVEPIKDGLACYAVVPKMLNQGKRFVSHGYWYDFAFDYSMDLSFTYQPKEDATEALDVKTEAEIISILQSFKGIS